MGFAVKLDSVSGHLDVAYNPERVGTKRYMAPEVLDNSLRQSSFEAYKQADMYSLGLVFWELTRRCYVPDLYEPEEYQLPYQKDLGHQRKLVNPDDPIKPNISVRGLPPEESLPRGVFVFQANRGVGAPQSAEDDHAKRETQEQSLPPQQSIAETPSVDPNVLPEAVKP
ncbi:unnamed protein product, partial [Dibothriocephalus latus]